MVVWGGTGDTIQPFVIGPRELEIQKCLCTVRNDLWKLGKKWTNARYHPNSAL